MRRRGRPCKGSEDSRSVRRTKTLRLTDEETKVISDNALKCRMNFSEYCRKVLLGYRPCVPDPIPILGYDMYCLCPNILVE